MLLQQILEIHKQNVLAINRVHPYFIFLQYGLTCSYHLSSINERNSNQNIQRLVSNNEFIHLIQIIH